MLFEAEIITDASVYRVNIEAKDIMEAHQFIGKALVFGPVTQPLAHIPGEGSMLTLDLVNSKLKSYQVRPAADQSYALSEPPEEESVHPEEGAFNMNRTVTFLGQQVTLSMLAYGIGGAVYVLPYEVNGKAPIDAVMTQGSLETLMANNFPDLEYVSPPFIEMDIASMEEYLIDYAEQHYTAIAERIVKHAARDAVAVRGLFEK